VHAGSLGPLYYPGEELSKTPEVWNHKPIVVYHPQKNGRGVSACSPDVINTHKVGMIMNAVFKKKKLHAEAWLEKDRLKKVDNRVLEAIEAEETMEVSTGLFTDNEHKPGKYGVEPYDYIARNYRPDHLAILPDQVGACSRAKGAGLLRNSATLPPRVQAAAAAFANAEAERLLANEVSHQNISSTIWSMMQKKFGVGTGMVGECWVADVYDKFFIYQVDGQLYQQGYTVTKDDEVTLVGDPTKVKRVSEYRTEDGAYVGNAAAPIEEERTMDKKATVDALIANAANQWGEADRVALMAMPDDQLKKLVGMTANTAPATPVQAPAAPTTAPVAPVVPATNTAPVVAPPSWDQVYASAPPEMRAAIQEGIAANARERAELSQAITANAQNTFSPEQLAAFDMPTLRSLHNFIPKAPTANSAPVLRPHYAGQPTPVAAPVANATKETAYVQPKMTW